MGCKCCKRRALTKIFENTKNYFAHGYDALESNESTTTSSESDNNIISLNNEVNNNEKNEKKEEIKNENEKVEDEEDLKEEVNEILIMVKEEKEELNKKEKLDIKEKDKKEIKNHEIKEKEEIKEKAGEEKIDETDKKNNNENKAENEEIKIKIDKEEKEEEENDEENEKKKLLMPYEFILKDYLDEKIDGKEVFDKKWYSDLEKDKIIYSKRSIVAFLKSLFDDKNNEFVELYNKDPLSIYVNSKGTFLSNEFQVVRSIYTINKNIYPPKTSIRMIAKYLNFIKERSSWDKQLKSYKIIEGSEKGNEVKCIVQNWLKSPMFLVSERDIIDKRYEFFYEGKFYSCESSVNDDYYPLDKNVTRINDIISIEELYEENDNIVLKAITQMNTKVSLPQAIINATLSTKLLDFYKGLADAMNNDYKNSKLIFEDNDGNII